MKYVKILEQKGLKKEDLAKQTQKKIDQLEQLKSQLDEFDKEDFDEEDKEKYEFIQSSILELDIELERNIRKFDVDIYKKRLEVFEQNKKQGTKKEDKAPEKEVVEEVEDDNDVQVLEPAQAKVVEIKASDSHIVSVSAQTVEPQPDSQKVNSIKGKLASLKKELNVNTRKFDEDRIARQEVEEQEPIQVEAEEVEEFEKKANVKPKKGSLSIILMTIGFGILTFGSVMYFKERK